jgi:hypothetical protein
MTSIESDHVHVYIAGGWCWDSYIVGVRTMYSHVSDLRKVVRIRTLIHCSLIRRLSLSVDV